MSFVREESATFGAPAKSINELVIVLFVGVLGRWVRISSATKAYLILPDEAAEVALAGLAVLCQLVEKRGAARCLSAVCLSTDSPIVSGAFCVPTQTGYHEISFSSSLLRLGDASFIHRCVTRHASSVYDISLG